MKAKPFESFYRIGENECWGWLGEINNKGYGVYYSDGFHFAHRYSYRLHKGDIPAGLVIDHLCRNRSCVNPAHLEAVTTRENILRGEGETARNAVKTHCYKGHPLSGENLIVRFHTRDRRYFRQCRACR